MGVDRSGSRGNKRRVVASVFSGCCWIPHQAMLYVCISAFGEGTNLVSGWITRFRGDWDAPASKDATLRAIMVWRGRGLTSFGSLVGPYADVVHRVADVGLGSRSPRTFFFIFATVRNQRSPPELSPPTRKSANPIPAFRGIVILRQVSRLAPSLVYPCRGW